jgi:DNA polymerase III subunit delta
MNGVDKAMAHRVVLIVGDEEARRRQALDALLSAAGLQKDDFDLEVVDADGSPVHDWLASVGTIPFLADRRTLVVRHLLRVDADAIAGVDLKRLPDSSLLILVADDESGSEERVRRMKTTVRKGWEKVVGAQGGFIWTFEPNPKTVRTELKAELSSLGIKMTERAIDVLIEMTGSNLSRALGEIEKLALFVGNDRNIGEGDVRDLVLPSREWNVFEMVNSIVAGNVGEALKQLRILITNNQKAESAAFQSILPQLSRQMRLLWQARICLDAGCDMSDPSPSVLAQIPEKPNITKEPPFRQAALSRTAGKLTQPRLRRCFTILSDTDARLKGALPGFSSVDTLERMVLDLSQAISGRA